MVIRGSKQIDSEMLHIPELKSLIGKRAVIVVREDVSQSPATEQDWEEFFANAGTPLVDSELIESYREFDRNLTAPPIQ